MKTGSRLSALGFVAVAALLCFNCNSSSVHTVLGVPQIAVTSPTGTTYVQTLDVDFGPVGLDSVNARTITIANMGRAAFTVTSFERSDPFDAAFSYDTAALTVAPGAQVSFEVRFQPTVAGQASGALDLVITGGDPSKLHVNLVGVGVESLCSITPSDVLGFGAVTLGATGALQITVNNGSALEWKLSIGDIDGGATAQNAFVFAAGFLSGEHVLPPSDGTNPGQLIIPIEFHPKRVGADSATLVIAGPGACNRTLTLQGNGVEHVLDCEPQIDVNSLRVCGIDFGYVSPNTRVVKTVTFQNLGNQSITLTLGTIGQPDNFGEPYAIVTTATQFELPGQSEPVGVDIAFMPNALGQQNGSLTFSSTDSSQPTGKITLAGVGGGPLIDVAPAGLDFGQVADDTYITRRITLSNIGTDIPTTALDNLLLTGRPVIENDPNGELVIPTWPPAGYVDTVGIAAGATIDVLVRFAPTVAGEKHFQLRIPSNDPSKPDGLVVPVDGIGVNLPPCDYTISPPTLNFGGVEAGKQLMLTFTIFNNAANANDACLVQMLTLNTTSDAWTLVDGAFDSKSIPGGESLPIRVRFAPKQNGAYTGEVDFFISNPTRPQGSVSLSGVGEGTCLLISPRELDFGTLPVNCDSREHDVTIYNTCAVATSVATITLQQSGTEFSFTQRPPLPVSLAQGAQTTFKMRYHPSDVGEDNASVSVTITGATNAQVIPIYGSGAIGATQTDVYSQGSTPKADVLMIIDDSCSMTPLQDHLATNFDSFIAYAMQQQVDYHIAITTASWDLPQYPCGRFIPLPTYPHPNNPKVITPNTPNRTTVFQENVRVGTGGTGPFDESDIWPAYAALSAPLVNGWNAGFYRDEATLAVIGITDTKDHDPIGNSVSFYQAFFTNLKGAHRKSDFSYNGILPLSDSIPAGCSYQADWLETRPGRAEVLVAATGGLQADICATDWAQTMEKIGTRAFGKKTKFFLTQVPDMSQPITVTIDGFVFPQMGPRGDERWHYETTSQSVVFAQLAVPDPGATVSINYTVACL